MATGFCLGTWIMLLREKTKDKTPGGIIIPDSAKAKNAPFKGTVLFVGPKCEYVHTGDTIMFDRAGSFTDVVDDYNEEGELVGTLERVFLKEEYVMVVLNRDYTPKVEHKQSELYDNEEKEKLASVR